MELKLFNTIINDLIKYESDIDSDIWQKPHETIFLGTGDCEDIAILKMYYLAPYFPNLRLVYVIGGQGAHMVLALDNIGDPLILDNLTNDVKHISQTSYKYIYDIDRYGNVFIGGTKARGRVKKFDALEMKT